MAGVVDVLPARGAAPPRSPRSEQTHDRAAVALVLICESLCAVVLGVAAEVAKGGTLRLTVVGAAVALVGVRVVAGGLRDGGRGAVAWLGLALARVILLVPAVTVARDLRLVALLAALSALPYLAGSLPALTMRGVVAARREDISGALLLSGLGAGAGVLVAIAIANSAGDARLPALAPYAAAAGGFLAVANVLAHHRAGAGFSATVAVLGTVAGAVGVAVVTATPEAPGDAGTAGALAAAGVLSLGLLAATATASPRPVALGVDEAAGGPRLAVPAVSLLVVAAAAVRIAALRPVWLDEAGTARFAGGSLSSLLDGARTADAHPPLHAVVSWALSHVFGTGPLALRLPSLLAGVLLVPVVYAAATELYDRRAGIVAAVVAAVGPAVVWMSDAARPAALAALLAALSLWAMVRAVRRRRAIDWAVLAVSGSALLWTHQLGFLHVAVLHVGIAAVVLRRVRRREPVGRLATGWAVTLVLTAAAFVALVAYRGLGPPHVLPPLEYATTGAPGAGRSVFGLVGTATASVLGFHQADVTSRLLALWPLCILVAFLVFGRRWSLRGGLLVAAALTPFAFLLGAQVAGTPRTPPFAVEWVATAVPVLAIGLGRAASLAGTWPRTRVLALGAAAVLALALVDQGVRTQPVRRFDVNPAMQALATHAGRGDTVVYAPGVVRDLVRYDANDAKVVSLDRLSPDDVGHAREVQVVGAFAFGDKTTSDRTLALVKQLSSTRKLVLRAGTDDARVWVFR